MQIEWMVLCLTLIFLVPFLGFFITMNTIMGTTTLSISVTNAKWKDLFMEKRARRLMRRTGQKVPYDGTMSISCILMGDTHIRMLNTQYRQITKITDVLSFSYEYSPRRCYGEIAISVPRARVQAKTLNQSLQDEIEFLFVHGLLHLLDIDHTRSDAEDMKMRQLQKSILRRI